MQNPDTQTPASPNFEKLKTKLRELFELDKADLDFGIYRILRQRHTEISEFLDKHLAKTVRDALTTHGDLQNAQIVQDLEKAESAAATAGISPEQSPKVMELREKFAKGADLEATADEVYSHLLTFFSRYYQEGDFLGLQRATVHRREKYMIPYNGEEVKLVWANMDQYYIKSSELLRDYTFKVSANLGEIFKAKPEDVSTVKFKLVEGDTEKDNRKPDGKTTRAFALDDKNPFEEEGTTLCVRFRYREHISERNLQDKLNADTEKTLADSLPSKWKSLLFATDPSHQPKDKKDARTVLQKHLRSYTAKFLFDYFIHKDLGGFLRRELDFYIKNEVMHLDDIEDTTAPKAEEYLSKIRAIRHCALPVIQMLAQLEDFQKKLWLKKKFVIETRYCLTLDRVPEKFHTDICANDAQWKEWEDLVAISELGPRRKPEFLKAHPHLMIDSRHFTREFTLKLLASIGNLDATIDGVCFHSENFQALRLAQEKKYKGKSFLYTDPPYNSKTSAIAYKNTFNHSAWMSLIFDRLHEATKILGEEKLLAVAIDENEQERLGFILETLFPDFSKTCVTVVHNPGGIQGDNFSYSHEFVYFVFPSEGIHIGNVTREEADIVPLRDWGGEESKRGTAANCFYPIFTKDGKILSFGSVPEDDFHPSGAVIQQPDGVLAIYPIDQGGIERKWRFARQSVDTIKDDLTCEFVNGEWVIRRRKSIYRFKTVWDDKKYNANSYGSKLLGNILGPNQFSFPKSVFSVQDCIEAGTKNSKNCMVVDPFGGSGTTGHAVISLNRNDKGSRKYLLVEMGVYFDSVLIPRLKKVVYSTDWKDGKPQTRDTGISQSIKIVRLEGYEDTLNNLQLRRTPEQETTLAKGGGPVRDQYLLSYFLDVESTGSKSLLDLSGFRDPFNYKLNIATSTAGETKETTVDLVETFNWLLGLKVKHIDTAKGFLTVTGEKRAGDRCLIIWRTLSNERKTDNEALEKFLAKLAVNPADTEFDFLYVNGPHTLNDPHSKVHLIEEAFQRLMFDTTNFESLS